MTERLMTIPQVAQALGMSAAFVWRRGMTGEWPSYRFGRSRRMAQADVAAVLSASRQDGSIVTTETPAAAE